MNDWQPIDTAPKDGTAVLLYVPRAYSYPIKIGHWDAHDECWRTTHPDSIRPTHWMALPDLPAAAKQGDSHRG